MFSPILGATPIQVSIKNMQDEEEEERLTLVDEGQLYPQQPARTKR